MLCEKAFTVEAAETDELIAIARGRNVYLAEAMWTCFSPAANQVKRWIDERKIGNIESVKFTYHMKSINYAERVADEIRRGLKESEKVPLSATSNVMHILDEVRSQIGLVYTELE